MTLDSVQTGQSLNALFGQVADEFLRRQQAGENPDIEEYAARHPEAADLLRKLLHSVKVLDLSPLPAPTGATEQTAAPVLGDFRLVRQVGRGGMGIVYEAEQVSLQRRVALKVLPFAATLDDKRLRRFQNEARAAAGLHHTNIVPVHFVGCEHGVYYYAMQFIEGQDLASTIAQLRAQPARVPVPDSKRTVDERQRVASPESPVPDTGPLAGVSTERTTRSREYVRAVVRLGIQAAQALEYAHQMGVIHRDIKPGNLLVDMRGNLWIADFGLAYCQGQSGITMTGDLVGTLRYMSPEQALAKRVLVDHRTDVYSLGATLYELLTLQPAFAGKDREELLRQIAFEEAQPPRRLNKVIPAELETIVLKALEKNPNDRYATAQELADDLERHLKDEPIRARRPGIRLRLVKWARRHKPVVASAASIGAMLVVAMVAGSLWYAARASQLAEDRVRTNAQIDAALTEAAELESRAREEGPEESVNWARARELTRRAETLAESNLAEPMLVNRVRAVRARLVDGERDRRMLLWLEEARMAGFRLDENYDVNRSSEEYATAFRNYGIDVEAFTVEQASTRIAASAIRTELVAGLDDWAMNGPEKLDRKRLADIARGADRDTWRNQLREALTRRDLPALRKLSTSANVGVLSALSVHRLAVTTNLLGDNDAAAALLKRAQGAHRGDFGINHDLGFILSKKRPPELAEAIRFLTAASAIRPKNSWAHSNLGTALSQAGRLDEAIAEYRQAIQLKNTFPEAHFNLARVLRRNGDLDGAIAENRNAICLNKDFAAAYNNLGLALTDKGEYDAAIAACREAIRINEKLSEPHGNLGVALAHKGDLDAGIAECRTAIRLNPDDALAHNNLGTALGMKGRMDEAIAEFQEAIRLNNDLPYAHFNLGKVWLDKKDLEAAIREYREGIRLKKDDAKAHGNLGVALKQKGDLDAAIVEYREAIRLKGYPEVHNDLGNALAAKGQFVAAIAEYRESIRLKPNDHQVHYHLAVALHLARRLDAAIAEYREAIRLKDDWAEPHYNLASALDGKGQLDAAIAEYRDAIRLNKDLSEPHNNLGVALAQKGQLDAAIAEFREAIRLKKDNAAARQSLASTLAQLAVALEQQGFLDAAIAAWREAISLTKDNPQAHYDLGNALRDKGQPDAAIAEYREAIRLNPGYAEAYCNLGQALRGQGEFRAALQMLRRGHELGSKNPRWSYSSARWVSQCERMIELDAKLPEILDNKTKPESAKEQIELAEFCALKRLHAAGARFYEEAFAAESALRTVHRYNAACAAALAGTGRCKDAATLNDRERERLRAQALRWLRDDLTQATKEPGNARLAVEKKFQHWQRDPDLAGVRDPALVAALPPAEEIAWRDLWADVTKILGSPRQAR